MSAPVALTPDAVTALVDEARALAPTTFCAKRSLTMAEQALAKYRHPSSHWTSEHRRIMLRDAANSARLAIRYHTEGV